MLLAVMLVLLAIVYRMVHPASKEAATAEGVERQLTHLLPAGAEIVEMDADGDRLLVRINSNGATQILVIDLVGWRVVGIVDLKAQ